MKMDAAHKGSGRDRLNIIIHDRRPWLIIKYALFVSWCCKIEIGRDYGTA
jgi:hypothetical protein